MRLRPISDEDNSWRAIKAQWKREAESAGEDFSTFAIGSFAALDPIAGDDPKKAGLYGLYDGDSVRAFCQVNRLLMSRYSSPVLRARFVTVSPILDCGLADACEYGRVLVALFSGVVWLSRDTLLGNHIHFQLRSPGDSRFFSGLQASNPMSPFSKFSVSGAWVICSLKGTSDALPLAESA